ncbi:MAG: hypothetical protein BGO11_02740 [Solirubrobacterales bacterium 70-9]|nr:MAG: hypothetical protein BGO11_02740 [Solirubrobacterales bacterium 70-9]
MAVEVPTPARSLLFVQSDTAIGRVHDYHACWSEFGRKPIADACKSRQGTPTTRLDASQERKELGCEHDVGYPDRCRIGVDPFDEARQPRQGDPGIRLRERSEMLTQRRQKERSGSTCWVAHETWKRDAMVPRACGGSSS